MNEHTPPSSSASQGESSSYVNETVQRYLDSTPRPRLRIKGVYGIGRPVALRLWGFVLKIFKRKPKWRILLDNNGHWNVEEREFLGGWNYRGFGFSYDVAVLRMKEIQEARVAPKQVFYFD
jgi:hypothetical protein